MSTSVAGSDYSMGSADDSSLSATPIVPAVESDRESAEDEIAHMRRRLFRTLDHPDRPMIAIDCASISVDDLRATTAIFLTDSKLRESHNLVLAIPDRDEFDQSAAFELIQSIKESAFENGYDGKVSWLLIQEPSTELHALKALATRHGGHWHASV